jgi:uncharacterized protein
MAQDRCCRCPLTARVIDQTGTLSAEQRAALEAKLAAFEAQAGPQIVVLMVPTTQPEDIAAYAQRVADTWKIGRRDVGDGLLLVVARTTASCASRWPRRWKARCPTWPRARSSRNAITPGLQAAGDYAGGLNAGVDALMARIAARTCRRPPPERWPPGTTGGFDPGRAGWCSSSSRAGAGRVLTSVLRRKLGSLVTSGRGRRPWPGG